MKKSDWFLISIIIIIAVILLCIQNFIPKTENANVEITVDGNIFGTYSLSENATININDTNELLIEDGYALMIEANCPDQLCVHQNKISKNGESIICLPNKTIVTIVGGEESEVDAVSN